MLRYPKREKTVTESPFNRQIIIIINLLSLCLKQKPLHLGNLGPNHTLQTLKWHESEKIEQSRVGLSAEIVRINARYRTRFFRAKAKLHKSSKWQQLSKIDQIKKEKDLKAGLDTEEEQELKKAAKTWIELMNMDVKVDSEGEQGSDSGDDTDL